MGNPIWLEQELSAVQERHICRWLKSEAHLLGAVDRWTPVNLRD